MSKRLGGIIGCKDKTSSWHLNRFPDGSNVVVSAIQRIGCQPEKTLYMIANPARGLLNREEKTKEKVWQHTLPTLRVLILVHSTGDIK